VHRATLLLAALLVWIAAGAGAAFPITTTDDWNDGTFTNTTAITGEIRLSGSNTTGTYTSQVFDAGDTYAWDSIRTQGTLNGGNAVLTVATSADDFATVQERETVTLSGGTEIVNLSSLSASRYIRFNYTLVEGSSSPTVASTNVTIGDSTYFLIRDQACEPDEAELFSLSNRTNAHAADPGHYDQYRVCSAGIDNSDYDSVCVGDETPVLSFFGSEQNYTHLSVEDEYFDQKLCTGRLSIGIRNSCPDTTKAIVSIYDLPESHIATPGHYPHQLCGAVFDEVSLMMAFHLGDNDTVAINGSANPDDGMYRNEDGWETGVISAANASMVAGIVSGENTETTGIGYQEQGSDHVFNVTQTRHTASYFIPFTVGDRFTLQNRVPLIAEDEFRAQFNPNFGYELVETMLVQLTLQFSDVDLVTDMVLSNGIHRLEITNRGTNDDGETQVGVNVTAR
jgi:hypothetical protein